MLIFPRMLYKNSRTVKHCFKRLLSKKSEEMCNRCSKGGKQRPNTKEQNNQNVKPVFCDPIFF